jgi:hypothetical protein
VDIAATLADITAALRGVHSFGTVYTFLPEQVSAPCAIVALGDENEYDEDFAGSVNLQVKVLCLATRADAESAQRQLFKWAAPTGAESVRAALVGEAAITGFGAPATFDIGEVSYLGIEFTGEVLT